MTTATTRKPPATATELLNQAADVLEQGWVQGAYYDEGGKYCAIGALDKVWMGDPIEEFSINGSVYRRAISRLAKHLRANGIHERYPWSRGDAALVIHWNDDRMRTQAEVVAALREAASA